MEATKQEQYIEIGIKKGRYALRIHDIHEIIRMQDITEIPNSKQYIKGVINLRGKIVPVISLRHRFDLEEGSYSDSTRIVVVNYADEMIGIIVDRVHQVTAFSDIQPPPERIGDVQGSFFAGIGTTNTGLISIIDLERVLRA